MQICICIPKSLICLWFSGIVDSRTKMSLSNCCHLWVWELAMVSHCTPSWRWNSPFRDVSERLESLRVFLSSRRFWENERFVRKYWQNGMARRLDRSSPCKTRSQASTVGCCLCDHRAERLLCMWTCCFFGFCSWCLRVSLDPRHWVGHFVSRSASNACTCRIGPDSLWSTIWNNPSFATFSIDLFFSRENFAFHSCWGLLPGLEQRVLKKEEVIQILTRYQYHRCCPRSHWRPIGLAVVVQHND